MVEVIFTSGTLLSAPTWRELEAKLRENQWNAGYSKRAFRIEMKRRAKVWSLTRVHRPASARDLFEQLEGAGILRIIESDEEVTA